MKNKALYVFGLLLLGSLVFVSAALAADAVEVAA